MIRLDETRIESIRVGLVKQQAAERLLNGPSSEATILAILLGNVLHGRATITSMMRNGPVDSHHHKIDIVIEYDMPPPGDPSPLPL